MAADFGAQLIDRRDVAGHCSQERSPEAGFRRMEIVEASDDEEEEAGD